MSKADYKVPEHGRKHILFTYNINWTLDNALAEKFQIIPACKAAKFPFDSFQSHILKASS